MTVSTIASIATGISRTIDNQNSNVSSSTSATAVTPQARGDIVTYPSELQKEGVSLRVAAQSISRTGSQLDAASSGASQITSLISQLQGIATQASLGGITDSRRNALNAEFQSLRQQINNVATDSSVDGVSLIDGSTSASATPATAIGSLTTTSLFGDDDIDVSTEENAQSALTRLTNAQAYATTQLATINTTKAAVDYTASTVESALQNQEAARSTITDSDFNSTVNTSAQARVQSQSADALVAQTNRLPADILKLLAE